MTFAAEVAVFSEAEARQLMARLQPLTDSKGNIWHRPSVLTPKGWLICDTVYGTICHEGSQYACYPEPLQTTPSATFNTFREAADYMARAA